MTKVIELNDTELDAISGGFYNTEKGYGVKVASSADTDHKLKLGGQEGEPRKQVVLSSETQEPNGRII